MVDLFVILALILLLAVVALLRFVGCASFGSSTPAETPPPPVLSISPTSKTAGDPDFTLTANGTGFVDNPVDPVKNSQVQWKGSPRPTTFVSATQLTAAITAADIAIAGSATVAVSTPPHLDANFTINPKPTISGFDPPDATAGDPDFELTVNGSNFSDGGLKVKFGNTDLTPGSVTDTVIKITVPATELGSPRPVTVTVTNGNGATSGPLTFTIFPLVTVTFPGPQPGTGNNLNFDAKWGWETGTSDDPFSHIFFVAGGLSGTFTFAGPRLLKSMEVAANAFPGTVMVTDNTTNPLQSLPIDAIPPRIRGTSLRFPINWKLKSTTVSVAFNNPNSLSIHKITYQGPA